MERLVNCDINIMIETIERITGGNRQFEIVLATRDDILSQPKWYKLCFNHVVALRYTIENGFLDRGVKLSRAVDNNSTVLIIENSELKQEFSREVAGTFKTDDIDCYFIGDNTDTIIEVLSIGKPTLIQYEPTSEENENSSLITY